MKLKHAILATLSRDELKQLVDDLKIDGVDRRSVDAMRKRLSRARSVSAAELLGRLRKDEIREVCRAVGVPGDGKKQDLIDRLINGEPDKDGAVAKPAEELPSKLSNSKTLDLRALEDWLWDAACTIRGPIDAPKYKNYILPLIFLKRLSDVFDDEVTHLAAEFGDRLAAAKLVEQDHKLVRFYIPPIARWEVIAEKKWNELRQAKGG